MTSQSMTGYPPLGDAGPILRTHTAEDWRPSHPSRLTRWRLTRWRLPHPPGWWRQPSQQADLLEEHPARGHSHDRRAPPEAVPACRRR